MTLLEGHQVQETKFHQLKNVETPLTKSEISMIKTIIYTRADRIIFQDAINVSLCFV